MNTEAFLKKAADWFILIKAPDLSEHVKAAINCVKEKQALDDKQKKLLGFFLFGYSMYMGPAYFDLIEDCAKEIGVTEEVEYYANDWIQYRQSKKA